MFVPGRVAALRMPRGLSQIIVGNDRPVEPELAGFAIEGAEGASGIGYRRRVESGTSIEAAGLIRDWLNRRP